MNDLFRSFLVDGEDILTVSSQGNHSTGSQSSGAPPDLTPPSGFHLRVSGGGGIGGGGLGSAGSNSGSRFGGGLGTPAGGGGYDGNSAGLAGMRRRANTSPECDDMILSSVPSSTQVRASCCFWGAFFCSCLFLALAGRKDGIKNSRRGIVGIGCSWHLAQPHDHYHHPFLSTHLLVAWLPGVSLSHRDAPPHPTHILVSSPRYPLPPTASLLPPRSAHNFPPSCVHPPPTHLLSCRTGTAHLRFRPSFPADLPVPLPPLPHGDGHAARPRGLPAAPRGSPEPRQQPQHPRRRAQRCRRGRRNPIVTGLFPRRRRSYAREPPA